MRGFVLLLAIAFAAPAALAQTSPIIAYPPQNDTVSLSLSIEDWTQTQTARTEMEVDAAMPGADAGKVRGEVLNAVKNLTQNTDWRFTRFDRSQDNTGLDHWYAVLEARLAEAQLGGLADRAKQASRPGLQIKVRTIDFSPTLAETEATRSKLRGEMYKRVNEALVQLGQAEPDRKFRIQNIVFGAETIALQPQYSVSRAMSSAPAPMVEQQTVELSQKVELHATVTFAAIAPHD